ncbi:cell division protein SepF [Anaerococcus sp. AGMB09787]|uniref:cell division protein SepF n=1 Tax=Anaerococcus sp. AGMB09787 TaxID=2922869 RepID=UPI001FAE893A|nr:cell division protein SepF [Anaerococcus sp. AGMB09787]
MLDRFKEFIGIDDNYDDYDDEQLYYDDEDEKVETKPVETTNKTNYSSLFSDKSYEGDDSTYSTNSSKDKEVSYNFSTTSRRGDNIVNMNDKTFSPSAGMRISIQEPLEYDQDAPKVIDDILNRKVVVLNLEMVDTDLRRRIFDFVSGAVYAVDGSVTKVNKGIFIISPSGVEVSQDIREQVEDGNYNQL